LIKTCFKAEEPDWVSTKPVVEADWNACIQTFEGHGDWVTSVAFSRDGQRLASGSDDKTIKIWDPATGSCIQTFEGHGGPVASVAFSRDGQRLASGSDDKTIKIWDTATGSCIQTFEGHGGWVRSVAFSRDGQRLASGSDDKTIKIWNTATGNCIQTFDTNWYIFTDTGYIKMGRAPVDNSTEPHDPETQSYGFGQDWSWITCNGQNVLWLPPEYRPGCVAFKGRMISVGCSSGRVFVITFSRDV
jgi:WD40 repeat protein